MGWDSMGKKSPVVIENYKILQKNLEKMKKAPQIVIERTMSDARSRMPGWIAEEVSKVYNIKKSDVAKRGGIRVEGSSIDTIQVRYKATRMTPVHFGMTPKEPKPNRGTYTIKAQYLRGKPVVIGRYKKPTKKERALYGKNYTRSGTQTSPKSPFMLTQTGTNDANKVQYIPFQRVSTNRKDLHKAVWRSVPEMVRSPKVMPNVDAAINEKLGKRLDHHMKLLEK